MERYAVIEFEEYPDEWVRVRLTGASVRLYNAIIEAFNEAVVRWMPEPIEKLCDAIAPFLDSWSYPEAADGDGLRERDPAFVFAIARAWVREVRDVPLPLPRKSSDGAPSEDQTADSPAPQPSPTPSSTTPS